MHPHMADNTNTEEDPSIEEILDSIRKIISDDDVEEEESADEPVMAEPEPEPPAPEPEPVVAEPEPEPVMAEPEPEPPTPQPEPEPVMAEPEPEPPAPEPEPVVAEPEPEPPAPEPEPEPDPDPIEEDILVLTEKAPPETESEDETPGGLQVDLRDAVEDEARVKEEPRSQGSELLSARAEDAAYDAFSNLARTVALGKASLTIEDIVRDEIKPMLKVWLDEHLESVIDRLVKEELERVANRVLEE